jgi:endonuclease YncB( thermonuclease family)
MALADEPTPSSQAQPAPGGESQTSTPPSVAPALPAGANAAPPASLAATAPAQPEIETQINDPVRVLDTVVALDHPDSNGEPVGRIRAGVRLKAVGIVAGGKWVQIQLPNENIAYVPRSAMALDPAGRPLNELEKVAGAVSSVPNAANLVIGERTIRLAGVDAGPAAALGPFEAWVKGQGSLDCEPAAGTGAFHCYTSKGVDVGEAAILNGVARAGDGAGALYRERETAAREAKKGLWGQP